MQLVRDIHAAKLAARQPVISFEFFPPRTEEGDRALLEKTIPALLQLESPIIAPSPMARGAARVIRR